MADRWEYWRPRHSSSMASAGQATTLRRSCRRSSARCSGPLRRSSGSLRARRVRRCARIGVCASLALLAPAPLSAQVRRDSARVRIVENTTPAWLPGCAWTVDPRPVVEIGRGRDEHDLLAYVSGAVILPTGRVLVGNNGTQSVLAFDLDGRFAGQWGRPGNGPGEFRAVGIVQLLGRDSVLIEDREPGGGIRGLTIWTTSGRFVRRFAVPSRGPKAAQRMLEALGRMKSGAFVGILRSGGIFQLESQRLAQRPWWLAIVGADQKISATVGPLTSQDIFEMMVDIYPESRPAPYSAPVTARVFGDRIYYTAAKAFEIQLFDASGALRETFRRSVNPKRVDEAAKTAFRRSFTAAVELEAQQIALKGHAKSARLQRHNLGVWLRNAPFPASAPAISNFVVDQQGYLWVEDYALFSDTVATWSILDPRGRYLGSIRRPLDVETMFVSDTLVLGRATDADGVETMRVYRVRGRFSSRTQQRPGQSSSSAKPCPPSL